MELGQLEISLPIPHLAHQSDHVLSLLVLHRLRLEAFEHLEHELNLEHQH